jgi:hypothetical protein
VIGTDRWLSFTNDNDHHYIAEILLIMALNTITLTLVIGIKISTSVVISTGLDIPRKMLIQLPLSYHHCLLIVYQKIWIFLQ